MVYVVFRMGARGPESNRIEAEAGGPADRINRTARREKPGAAYERGKKVIFQYFGLGKSEAWR